MIKEDVSFIIQTMMVTEESSSIVQNYEDVANRSYRNAGTQLLSNATLKPSTPNSLFTSHLKREISQVTTSLLGRLVAWFVPRRFNAFVSSFDVRFAVGKVPME
jgi:hypothetical protein